MSKTNYKVTVMIFFIKNYGCKIFFLTPCLSKNPMFITGPSTAVAVGAASTITHAQITADRCSCHIKKLSSLVILYY